MDFKVVENLDLILWSNFAFFHYFCNYLKICMYCMNPTKITLLHTIDFCIALTSREKKNEAFKMSPTLRRKRPFFFLFAWKKNIIFFFIFLSENQLWNCFCCNTFVHNKKKKHFHEKKERKLHCSIFHQFEEDGVDDDKS